MLPVVVRGFEGPFMRQLPPIFNVSRGCRRKIPLRPIRNARALQFGRVGCWGKIILAWNTGAPSKVVVVGPPRGLCHQVFDRFA